MCTLEQEFCTYFKHIQNLIDEVYMEGDAKTVAKGHILPEAWKDV